MLFKLRVKQEFLSILMMSFFYFRFGYDYSVFIFIAFTYESKLHSD